MPTVAHQRKQVLSAAKATDLRSADTVMSVRRAGAAVSNALAFSRSAMREIVRGRWRIEKLRFDLDEEGRGEILYRFTDGRWKFHFFLVSLKLPEEQKIDRNWAASWDAMGVLCQGEWTHEREALLRVEVPKQRSGYADYDTLVYARGNRSGRLFEHVVESLASGRQPDLRMIARVGYILRTTAFIANGQLGTRAYAGFEPDHPFRHPYHAQMCSAFLLREYVFDLVDHIARARNSKAARLDPAYRRYLGLGNSASTGLVSFVVNHPRLMHQWSLTHESALAEAKARPMRPGDRAATAFGRLLDKTIYYLREAEDARADLFGTSGAVAADLEQLRAVFAEYQALGTCPGTVAQSCWPALASWAERNAGPEAVELFNSIVLEVYPDLTEAVADAFYADERLETRPEMPVPALRDLLRAHYGWALAEDFGERTHKYFWFRSTQAPRENRRGIRDLAPEFEAENGMDTARQVRQLWNRLAGASNGATTAELLCAHPELRHIVARIQSLAGLDYAELRTNWLSPAFSPFEPVRFVLAFYGLEKFEAAPPKSVRGAFLQGAPIAEDVEQGRDGDWPFPLIPATGSYPIELAPLPPPALGAVHPAAPPPERKALQIAPNELARIVQMSLQGHGATLGVAEEAAAIVAFAHGCDEQAVAAFLRQCEAGLAPRDARVTLSHQDNEHCVLDAHGASALLAAPTALDLACAQARISSTRSGCTLVLNAASPAMLGQLALRCAERGLLGLVVWHSPSTGAGFAIAGADAEGLWYACAPSTGSGATHEAAVTALGPRAGSFVDAVAEVPGRFGIFCASGASAGLLDRLVSAGYVGSSRSSLAWKASDLHERQIGWQRRGLEIASAELAALNRAAAALLVPAAEVPRLRPHEDPDPLKIF